MDFKQKAEEIYDEWAEEVGWYSDPTIIPRKDFPSEDHYNEWGILLNLIEKALQNANLDKENR